MSPQRLEAKIAPVVHIGDEQAQNIHVGGDHDPLAGSFFVADDVAHKVGSDLVGKGAGQLGQDGGLGPLKARGLRGGGQPGQKFKRFHHGLPLLNLSKMP